MIDLSWSEIVSAAIVEKPVELHIKPLIRDDQIGPAGVELQFHRRAERPVAGDLTGEKATAEPDPTEQVLLARRQNVIGVLTTDRGLQRRLHVAERKQILHA